MSASMEKKDIYSCKGRDDAVCLSIDNDIPCGVSFGRFNIRGGNWPAPPFASTLRST